MIREIWENIENEVSIIAPQLISYLHPGANSFAIEQNEKLVGLILPEVCKTFFRCVNGSKGAIFDNWQFLSIEEVGREWSRMRVQNEEKRRETSHVPLPSSFATLRWKEDWIPFVRVCSVPHTWLYVNIAPEPQERFLWILCWEENASGYISIVARSIEEFLSMIAEKLANGSYVFDDQTHQLVSQEAAIFPNWIPAAAFLFEAQEADRDVGEAFQSSFHHLTMSDSQIQIGEEGEMLEQPMLHWIATGNVSKRAQEVIEHAGGKLIVREEEPKVILVALPHKMNELHYVRYYAQKIQIEKDIFIPVGNEQVVWVSPHTHQNVSLASIDQTELITEYEHMERERQKWQSGEPPALSLEDESHCLDDPLF